jgi:hypothetical protein
MLTLDIDGLNTVKKIFKGAELPAPPKPGVIRSELIPLLTSSVRYDVHIHDAFIAFIEPDNQCNAIPLASNGGKKPTKLPIPTW